MTAHACSYDAGVHTATRTHRIPHTPRWIFSILSLLRCGQARTRKKRENRKVRLVRLGRLKVSDNEYLSKLSGKGIMPNLPDYPNSQRYKTNNTCNHSNTAEHHIGQPYSYLFFQLVNYNEQPRVHWVVPMRSKSALQPRLPTGRSASETCSASMLATPTAEHSYS